MVSGIVWIIFIGIVFYTAVLYKSTALALMGCAGAVLYMLACLFLAYRSSTVRCRVFVPVSIAECGRPADVRIVVENGSFLACGKFKCRLGYGSSFLKRGRREWLCGGILAPGENSFDHSVVFKNYGSYSIQVDRIRIYDLTGLFFRNKKVNSTAAIRVFPRLKETGVYLTDRVRGFYGDAEVYDAFHPGQDRSELFAVRPFQDGDKLQSIHWKLSAKTDDWLVREDSMPKACPVVFLLDYKMKKQKNMRKVDAYLVILAGISFSMMAAGCPHYMAWHDSGNKDAARMRVDDEESFYLFLSGYLEETFQDEGSDLKAAYQEKYRGENYLYILRFNEKLELTKNGDLIEKFTLPDWERQLEELELLL